MGTTTIQVNELTLMFLKQLKQQYGAASYDEVIMKLKSRAGGKKSMAGCLGHLDSKKILKELQEERRKSDRF